MMMSSRCLLPRQVDSSCLWLVHLSKEAGAGSLTVQDAMQQSDVNASSVRASKIRQSKDCERADAQDRGACWIIHTRQRPQGFAYHSIMDIKRKRNRSHGVTIHWYHGRSNVSGILQCKIRLATTGV